MFVFAVLALVALISWQQVCKLERDVVALINRAIAAAEAAIDRIIKNREAP